MAVTSRATKRISSPVTKRNPRPRKYASQAERQAAYRARNVMLEFRAEPKTADNISKIADTLGYARSDVLLSMVKFALTNHDWARFGLTHKTIPTYKENPTMKKSASWVIVNKETGEPVLETYNEKILSKLNTEKYEAIPALKYLVALNKKIKENPTMKPASPAQLAARKRFAEMARSGAFKKATKRKANPASGSNAGKGIYILEYKGFEVNEPYDTGLISNFPILFSNQNDAKKAEQRLNDEYGADIYKSRVRKITAKEAKSWADVGYDLPKPNPAKKTVSQKISQLRHEGYPQRQAVAVALSEQRAGKVKRNPSGLYAMKNQYLVSCPATKKNMGFFDKQSDAKIYAQELADKHGMQYAISTVKVPKIQAVHFVVGESTKSFKV